MRDRDRTPRDDEPEVTFELDEAPLPRSKEQPGVAAGAAAVAGAGLVSSAAVSAPDESFDIFDAMDDGSETDDVPVTNFQDAVSETTDPELPPIDFVATDDSPAGSDAIYGASAAVGGGFVASDDTAWTAFGATEAEVDLAPADFDAPELVPDAFVDDTPDDDLEAGTDPLDDIS